MRYQSATIQEAIDALRDKGKAWMIVPISPSTTIEELAGSDGVIVEDSTKPAPSTEPAPQIIDHDKIMQLAKSGMSVKEIVKETGYKYSTVYSYLRFKNIDKNIDARDPGIDTGKISALYQAGRSPQWIATDMQMQLYTSTIRKNRDRTFETWLKI